MASGWLEAAMEVGGVLEELGGGVRGAWGLLPGASSWRRPTTPGVSHPHPCLTQGHCLVYPCSLTHDLTPPAGTCVWGALASYYSPQMEGTCP